MLIKGYLIDREYQFDPVVIEIKPYNLFKTKEQLAQIQQQTFYYLLDGEIVMDVIEGKNQLSYYLFDCIYDGIEDATHLEFQQRLNKIKNLQQVFYKINFQKQQVFTKQKQFYSDKQLDQISKQLPHNSDGIVFTRNDADYIYGSNHYMLKWKPRQQNTVDLAVVPIQNQKNGEQIYWLKFLCQGPERQQRLDNFVQVPDCGIQKVDKEFYQKAMKSKSYKEQGYLILECYFDSEQKGIQGEIVENQIIEKEVQGQWTGFKPRKDKKMPNAFNTYLSVIDASKNWITKEQLLTYIRGEDNYPGTSVNKNPFTLVHMNLFEKQTIENDDE